MAAVVAEGELGKEALGGGGLPWEVGLRVRCARSPVFGVQAPADCVAEVLRPFLRDLGQVPHALAVTVSPAMAQLVRARQAIRGGDPHAEPMVEVLKPRRQRLLGGLVIPRPGRLTV